MQELQEHLQKFPDDKQTRLKFGRMLFDVGHFEAALYELKQADVEKSGEVNFWMGYCNLRLGKPDDAIRCYEECVKLKNQSAREIAFSYNHLGSLLRQKGKIAEAENAFLNGLNLIPPNEKASDELFLLLSQNLRSIMTSKENPNSPTKNSNSSTSSTTTTTTTSTPMGNVPIIGSSNSSFSMPPPSPRSSSGGGLVAGGDTSPKFSHVNTPPTPIVIDWSTIEYRIDSRIQQRFLDLERSLYQSVFEKLLNVFDQRLNVLHTNVQRLDSKLKEIEKRPREAEVKITGSGSDIGIAQSGGNNTGNAINSDQQDAKRQKLS